ncbi:phage tail protein [Sphingobium lactosutens]|uniref:TipJ family phage tail tip protein n=1 Tax=Sphingobium lactosutens TaxID=522773 RepID=UPI001D18328C|nr:phage tail protein [Sphingobium lactosutens]MCC4257011.1 phage tail protein [Sphingobium lactosutens]
MTVRVMLYGAFKDKAPTGYKRGITVHAKTAKEAVAALEQLIPISRMIAVTPAEFRIGKSWKNSTSLTGQQVQDNWQLPEGTTLHIGPHAGGHEITTAMLITALISTAVGIAVNMLLNLLMPVAQTKNDKRKSALYENGLNTQTEGAVLAYIAGDQVLCGFNVLEADVDYSSPMNSPQSAWEAKFGGTGVFRATDALQTAMAANGKKGGGKTISNTTYSDATLRLTAALGAGEIGGIVGDTIEDKEKNILVNEVPLRDRGTGQLNYNGISWAERYGVEGQSAVPITPGIPANFDSNIELRQTQAGGGSQFYITNTVTNADVNRVKARIRFNGLVKTSKKGNQSTTVVQGGFDVKRLSAPTWTTAGQWYVNEKSSDPFVRDYSIAAPPKTVGDDSDPWMYRVYRTTPDSTDDKLQNDTAFNGWVEYQDIELAYDGSGGEVPTALFSSMIDLAQFDLGSSPEIAVIVRGQKVRVPDNYDPVAKTYDGFWNGAWKYAVTSNPVWHWLEIATHPRMGCGFPEEFFNKFALLATAKYCDEQVNGRTRFTLNKQFTDEQDGWQGLIDLAQTFRAYPYFNGSEIVLMQDRPQDAVDHYVNNSASADGKFKYGSAPIQDRLNEVIVEFDDPADYYRKAMVVYRDQPSIDRNRALGIANNGVVSRTVYKTGCTNRQEAYDFARILVFAAQKEYVTVEFDTLLAGAGYAPGQLIEVDDWTRSGKKPTGRVLEVISPTQLRLDQPIPVRAGTAYRAHMIVGNGLDTRAVTMFGSDTTTDIINVDTTDLEADTPIGIVEFSPSAVQPRVFRIKDIVEAGQGRYTVKGTLHHEGKFAFFDDNVPVDYSPWTQLNPITPTPTGLKAIPRSYTDEQLGPQNVFEVSWDAVELNTEDGYRLLLQGYSLEVRRPGNSTWEEVYRGPNTFATMRNAEPGEHVFSLRSLNTLGKASPALVLRVSFEYGENGAVVYPPEFLRFD